MTVLFCDVVGSTMLAEQLDPEEWAELINEAYAQLSASISHYEGTIVRLLGDAILAIFGAPIAHEDDPERGVLAGLEILERMRSFRETVSRRWGLDFDVRIGINTGLVIVGAVGDSQRLEYTALGDAVNLAARMEETAAPGTLQIADATYRAVARRFEVEPLGPIEVKGKSEPVPAYRVLRPRPGYTSIRGIEGLASPLVGRDKELAVLQSAVAELQSGRGQILGILGEAGLGKSRLVAELRLRLSQDNPERDATMAEPGSTLSLTPRWCEGRVLSYESMTPYAPFISLFRSCLSLTGERPGDGFSQLAEQISALAPDQSDEIVPYLATLLGVPLSSDAFERVRYLEPQQLREWIFQATFRYIALLAQERPLVIVFEDLHWADPTSIELIERLLVLTDKAPLLLLLVFRPLRQEPSWRLHEIAARDYPHRYTALLLEPLDDTQSRQLVTNLLHLDNLSQAIRQTILDKAEGNPFYVEELIRALLDAGIIQQQTGRWVVTQNIETVRLPETLGGILTARLDRSDPTSRQVAQTAAVIGREFSYGILWHAMNGTGTDQLDLALRELQRRELIRELDATPDRRFRFKHVLTQEAIYNSLLHSRRRQIHRHVAQALEALHTDQIDELHPLLSYHYARAEDWERALEHAEQAGNEAQAAYANREALEYYDQALLAAERAGADAAARSRLHRSRGQTHDTLGQFDAALADFETALRLAEESPDRQMEWQLLLDLGLLWASRDYSRTREYDEQALALARTLGDPSMIAHSLNRLGNLYINIEEPEVALTHHREALEIFYRLGDRRGLAETHDLLSMATAIRGGFDSASQHIERAAELFRELDNRRGLTQSLLMLAWQAGEYRIEPGASEYANYATGLKNAEQALQIARELGWQAQEAFILSIIALVAGARGDYARALQMAEQSRSLAEKAGHHQWRTSSYSTLGLIHFDLLAFSSAQHYLEQALSLAREIQSVFWVRMITGFLATLHLERGDLSAAQRLLQPELAAAQDVQTMGQWHVRYARARLDVLLGNPAQALTIADRLATPMIPDGKQLNPIMLGKLRGEALIALGRPAEAESELRSALGVAETHGFRPQQWRLLALLSQLYQSEGRSDDAADEQARALAIVEQLSANVTNDELRRHFRQAAKARLSAEPMAPEQTEPGRPESD